MMNKLAIVIIAYADYESLELSLAAHSKHLPLMDNEGNRVKIYILQNGRGSYDCERTHEVALRYSFLFPKDIFVIDDIPQQKPYSAIATLLNSERFKPYKYILKMDDDVLPLTSTWLKDLCSCWENSYKKYGSQLAYVTGLVNNNPFGFKHVLDCMNLWDEYFNEIAREHCVGVSIDDSYSPYRILPKEKISTGGFGTIWRIAYFSRWLHEKTTLNPEAFIEATKDLGYATVSNKERYSINCIFFNKALWNEIYDGGNDDELMLQKFCLKNNKIIISNLKVPLCHLFFYPQRKENKDLISKFRVCYSDFLGLPFPISLCSDKLNEVENRLRFLEDFIYKNNLQLKSNSFGDKKKKKRFDYYKYKITSKLTFGATKERHQRKYQELKDYLKKES